MRATAFLALLLVAAAVATHVDMARINTEGSQMDDDYPADWMDLAKHEDNYRVAEALFKSPDSPLLKQARAKKINMTCGECEPLAQMLVELAMNKAELNATIGHFGRDYCRKNFTGKKEAECIDVVNVLVVLVNLATVDLNRLKFNLKEMVCADLLNLCVKECCKSPYKPEQVRLSFADNKPVQALSSWNVAWTTLNKTADAEVTWWAQATPSQVSTSQGSWRTYTDGGWVGIIHVATMTKLRPNTTYSYRVGSPSLGMSDTFNFTTMPLNVGTPERPLRVVGLADMGWDTNSNFTIQAIKELVRRGEVDFIIHPGDIGYADGDTHWWDYYLREMEPITSRVPYMTVQGNHEQLFWNATGYKVRFAMPEPGYGAPNDGTYYAFEAGPVSFFMLDSETVINTPYLDPVQMDWVGRRMAAYRANRKFIFANHHRPMYCSSYSKADCTIFAQWMRDMGEGVYMKYDVGAVMVGHIHNYERTYPVFNGSVVSKNYTHPHAPVYFVNGAAGNREGQSGFYTNENPWSVLRTKDRGFMTMVFVQEAEDAVRMTSKFIQSRTGTVVDTVDLVKKV